jgi:hypothetical protein
VTSQSARPVTATVTPGPVIATPPAPPMSDRRWSERANQVRAAYAVRPHRVSVTRATETGMRPSSGIGQSEQYAHMDRGRCGLLVVARNAPRSLT